jgi:hypothetical protein
MAFLPAKLSHIGAKVFRSIEHLKTLDQQITAFLDSEPYELVSTFDAQERTYTYRVEKRRDIPLSIPILTGEVLGQLRSALDHLTWQLALLNGPTPSESTEFPIFKDGLSYKRGRTRKIGSLGPSAQSIIDSLQPYLGATPEDDMLWVLHRLANDDKHRLPHLVAVAPTGIATGDRRGRDMAIEIRVGPFDEQTIIGRVIFLNPAEKDMEVQTDIRFDIAFPVDSAANGRLIRPELVNFGKRVEEIVRKFQPLF